MRQLDRISLLDTIGRELQSRMSFSDLEIYFKGHGVDTARSWSGTNSKWVYTKEMLADAPDELIAKIADELEIDHAISGSQGADSKFWVPGHLRIFISHVSTHKVTASNLQHALKKYAISSFVAHEDIEPTKEWLVEIEKALFSMDALIAIITPDFANSHWTDHEVGIAVGRQALVIPIRKGADPYGFIGKFQGLQSRGKTVSQVAQEVFQTLLVNSKTRDRLFGALVRQLLVVGSQDDANHWLQLLEEQDEIPRTHIEKLQATVADNRTLMGDNDLKERTCSLLKRQGFALPEAITGTSIGDDIPF